MPFALRLIFCVALIALISHPADAQTESPSEASKPAVRNEAVCIGPERGTLFIHGGGALPKSLMEEFIQLGGGIESTFVIIPTADAGDDQGDQSLERSFLRRAGVKEVSLLHTRDRKVADTDEFIAPLRQAKGVWIGGGRQWRLADAYLGTRTQRELFAVLERGGVIGGSSAGATIQGSYLVRGAPEGNHILMAPGHEEGFGFLKHTAIDQHVLARKRDTDLAEVLKAHPELLGLGIDEGTAAIVRGNHLRVSGSSQVLVHGAAQPGQDRETFLRLKAGDQFDLLSRKRIVRDEEAGAAQP